MRLWLSSHFQLPLRLRQVAQVVIVGGLVLAGFAAAAQAPTSIPEPLTAAPAPARPTDFLSPVFHK